MTILQLDDVGFTLHAPDDYPLVLKTLNRALEGVDAFKIFHICHLGSGVSVGVTPYAGFHELVANELEVDASSTRSPRPTSRRATSSCGSATRATRGSGWA